MVTLPTIIIAIIVYYLEASNWMLWLVIGFGIFSWICGKTYLRAYAYLKEGRESEEKVQKGWELIANLTIWVQLIICIVVIIISLYFN